MPEHQKHSKQRVLRTHTARAAATALVFMCYVRFITFDIQNSRPPAKHTHTRARVYHFIHVSLCCFVLSTIHSSEKEAELESAKSRQRQYNESQQTLCWFRESTPLQCKSLQLSTSSPTSIAHTAHFLPALRDSALSLSLLRFWFESRIPHQAARPSTWINNDLGTF